MFVIEKLKADHDVKVEAWRKARDKWVNDPEYKNHYREARGYERRNPRPVNYYKRTAKILVVVLAFISAGLLLVGFTKELQRQDANKPPLEAVESDTNCRGLNLDDRVRIQYGSYEGVKGTLVGGCEKHERYQVKLEEGSVADVTNDGTTNKVDVGGDIIGVKTIKNLTRIEE